MKTLKTLILVFGLFIITSFAYAAVNEDHPRIWLTPAYLAELRARAAANSTEWVTLKAWCDDNINTAGYDLGEYDWPNGVGYRGSKYYHYLFSYALAYQILKTSDPSTAATYATYALQIMDGIATGFQIGEDPAYGLACIRVGESVDGTTNIDEAAALGIYERGIKLGYSARTFGVSCAIAYDWLHDELSAEQKTIFAGMLLRWVDWFRGERTTYNNGVLFEGTRYYEDSGDVGAGENNNINGYGKGFSYGQWIMNFSGGYMAMTALAAYATYGDAGGETYVELWEGILNNVLKISYTHEREQKGGASPEGWNYGSGHSRILQAMWAQHTATDDAPFTNFDIAKDFFLAYFHSVRPYLAKICDRGNWTANEIGILYEYGSIRYQVILDELYPDDDYGGYAQYLIDNATFDQNAQPWQKFLWYDPDKVEVAPTAEPLFYHAEGGGVVTMRSSWTVADDTVWASVKLDNKWQTTHEYWDEGHFAIQRGDDYLVTKGADTGTDDHNTITFGGANQLKGLGIYDGASSGIERGATTVIDQIENDDDYFFVSGDLKDAYHRKWYMGRVTKCRRKFAYLRPNVFVLFDDTEADSATYNAKEWIIHFQNEPTIANDIMTSTVGTSKVFVKTLTPTDYSVSLTFQSTWRSDAWRVIEVPTATQAADIFIHVIYVGASSVSTMPTTLKIDSSAGNMAGAHIEGEGINYVALFHESNGSVTAPVTYTVVSSEGCKHFLFDMPADTVFDVSVAFSSTVVTITEDVEGGYTSTSEGVLVFETEAGGVSNSQLITVESI